MQRRWLASVAGCVKAEGHRRQEKGLLTKGASASCFRRWRASLLDSAKPLPQWRHLWGLTPVCTGRCCFRLLGLRKAAEQCGQGKGFSPGRQRENHLFVSLLNV